MTISVNLTSITDYITSLNITGVTVLDIDHIPETAMPIIPVLFPIPNGFITEMKFTRETQGADTVAAMNLEYTLNYRYLHAVVGSGGGLLAVYSGLIDNLVKIISAVFANSNPTGAIDMQLQNVTNIGVLTDPAGQTQFHGVDIALHILEYIQ